MIHSNSLHVLNQRRPMCGSVDVQRRIVDVISTECRTLWMQLRVVANAAASTSISVPRVRTLWGTPAFFQFERRGPAHQRLGPGLSRESDSFWAVSEW